MNLLPYEKFILITRMTPKAVYQEIQKSMTPSNEMGERIFRGKLEEDYFKITPWFILFYNGYLPVLKGKIVQKQNGSQILITIRPDLIQVSALILISLTILTGFVYQIVEVISNGRLFNEIGSLLMFPGVFAVFYIISMIAYMPNILKYKKLMQEALEAKETIEIGFFDRSLQREI